MAPEVGEPRWRPTAGWPDVTDASRGGVVSACGRGCWLSLFLAAANASECRGWHAAYLKQLQLRLRYGHLALAGAVLRTLRSLGKSSHAAALLPQSQNAYALPLLQRAVPRQLCLLPATWRRAPSLTTDFGRAAAGRCWPNCIFTSPALCAEAERQPAITAAFLCETAAQRVFHTLVVPA